MAEGGLIRKSDLWRRNYIQRRYLKDAEQGNLARRFRDVANNVLTLTDIGQIGFRNPKTEAEAERFYELMTHIQSEYHLREIAAPNLALEVGAEETRIRPTYPVPPSSVAAIARLKQKPSGQYLVKYGERKFIEPLFETGQLRISPAGSYADASLNPAIRDDELTIECLAPSEEISVSIIDRETGTPRPLSKPLSEVRFSRTSQSNYYVHCLATRLEHRLFSDFGYNACIVIHKPSKYQDRLLAAASSHLASWADWDQPVKYIDPYHANPDHVDAFFCKHFRYAYQREYRFAWVPLDPISHLEHLNINIGPMNDIAELVVV